MPCPTPSAIQLAWVVQALIVLFMFSGKNCLETMVISQKLCKIETSLLQTTNQPWGMTIKSCHFRCDLWGYSPIWANVLSNAIFAHLHSSWQDFNGNSAQHSPSVTAELLILLVLLFLITFDVLMEIHIMVIFIVIVILEFACITISSC